MPVIGALISGIFYLTFGMIFAIIRMIAILHADHRDAKRAQGERTKG